MLGELKLMLVAGFNQPGGYMKKIKQKSAPNRKFWVQFDALQMGSGWDEKDVKKPQILLEDAGGDSHPGSVHLGRLMEQAKYGVFECGGYPAQFHATDICDGCGRGMTV